MYLCMLSLCTLLLFICTKLFKNQFKKVIKLHNNDSRPPISVFIASKNWYQSLVPPRKPNNLRKIRDSKSMDSDLQKELNVAIEDIDTTRKEANSLRRNMSNVEDFIESLKEKVNTSREKRKEIMDKLKEKED